jgi:exopolysaccharide biosynthesis polyprenyl glycosylphosphotransferase
MAVADLLALSGIMMLAIFIRFWGQVPAEIYSSLMTFSPLLLPLRIFAVYLCGLYDMRHKLSVSDHFFAACGAALLGVIPGYLMLALVQLYGLEDVRVSRGAIALELPLLVLWLSLSRWALLTRLMAMGWRVRVALVGPGAACRDLAREIRDHAPIAVDVRGVLPLDGVGDEADILGDPAALESIVAREEIDHLILVQIDLPQDQLRDLLQHCDRSTADLYLYPDLNLSILVNTHVVSIAGLPLISLKPAFATPLYALGKRTMDILVAVALLAAGAPVLALAAVAVRQSSKGPAFFTQERLGRHGAPFTLYKLRTMAVDAEAASGPVLANADDPRVTPLGRRLRKWRIDEMPQLWNVLRGEMSLVGPRPEREAFSEQFTGENPLFDRRLLVRPGITGLAQIHGRYDTDHAHKLRYDLIYINSISLITDLRILLATIQTVTTGRGAM